MHKLLPGGAAAAILAMTPAVSQPVPPPPPPAAVPPAPQVQTFIHRMPMKTETRDDVVKHVREMFAKLDTNKDGFVTRQEADAAHQAMAGDFREHFAKRLAAGDFPKPDRGAAFDRLDANHDGVITRDEFVSAQPQIREQRVFVMRDGDGPVEVQGGPGEPHVKILRDGDGPVEIQDGPGEPHVKILRMHGMGMGPGMGMHGKMFERADANHDGRVSLEEMTNAALQHFDTADANHDGKLTPDERMQMHKERKAQKMQPA